MRKLAAALTVVLAATSLAIAPATAIGITKQRALHLTLHYAKHACQVDNRCRGYAASRCFRHSGGVSCVAWNYERHNGKYTCKRLVFWKGSHREFLTKWKCNLPGWNWGPGF
jgi:hypothetical protein